MVRNSYLLDFSILFLLLLWWDLADVIFHKWVWFCLLTLVVWQLEFFYVPLWTPRLYLESTESHHVNENTCILHMRAGSSPLWLRNLDSYTSRLETIVLLSHMVSASGGYFIPDGTILYLTMKSYAGPVSWQPLPSFANEDSDCSVMLPDSQRTSQQIRSFGLAAKPKTVPGHLLIGNALVVDLPSLGSIRSAGTREYQWPTLCSWQKIARFGDKSQRRNATAERFASW